MFSSKAATRLLFALTVAVAVTVVPQNAEACACMADFPTFSQTTVLVPVVVVGRVIEAQPLVPDRMYLPKDPRAVLLDVVWVAKGQIDGKRVRVWNLSAGTSCGGAFHGTRPGTWLVVAMQPVAGLREADSSFKEYWDSMKLSVPPDGDFVIENPCAEQMLVLETEAQRREHVGKSYP